jgi:hypothetical protein
MMVTTGDTALRPFWAKAQELAAVVYIHPGGNRDRRFKRFHLWNSVGQAFEEARRFRPRSASHENDMWTGCQHG